MYFELFPTNKLLFVNDSLSKSDVLAKKFIHSSKKNTFKEFASAISSIQDLFSQENASSSEAMINYHKV